MKAYSCGCGHDAGPRSPQPGGPAAGGLAAKVRFRFLVFLLAVLALAMALVAADGASTQRLRDAAALAGIAGLAGLSIWRHRWLAASAVGDVGAACLLLAIGWGIGQGHLVHVFGLALVHLFVRALDVSLPRVALNAVLHAAAYFGVVALALGPEGLARMDTATNLAWFAFAAGLMHTLATSFAKQEAMEADINFRALHDPLTGLPNRTLFNDRLQRALARSHRDGGRVALAFIDLDDFKDVNDSFGHAWGDRLLTALSERISSPLRASDTAARLGGDEFALILEDVGDADEAVAVVDRSLAAMREPFEAAGRPVRMSASVGIAVSCGDCDLDELLRRADIAMYSAKAAGKGHCQLYDAVMEAASHRQFNLDPAALPAG